MTIAQELEDRMWTLADPAVEWVKRCPYSPGEACLVCDAPPLEAKKHQWVMPSKKHQWVMPSSAQQWLDHFIAEYALEGGAAYACGGVMWNDHPNRTLDQVLWMLEEAVDQAKAEGV